MKVKKAELLNALEKVQPGLASRELIEQSTYFAFMGGRVVTYNDEISVSYNLPGFDLKGAVSAAEFYAFLNRTKVDEIVIEVVDSEIRLKAGRTKVGFALKEEIKLPLEELGKMKGWKPIPKEFFTAIKFCQFSCATSMSTPILTCLHVTKSGKVESSDNIRLTQYEIGEEMPVDSFLLPGAAVNDILHYSLEEMTTTQGWVHFRSADKNLLLSCRVFEDQFPDTSAVLDIGAKPKRIKLPTELQDALARAEVFAKAAGYLSGTMTQFKKRKIDSESFVRVHLEEGKTTISSKNDIGWCEESLDLVYKGAPFQFHINPGFLQDMVGKVKSCSLGETKVKFQGTQWTHTAGLITKVG